MPESDITSLKTMMEERFKSSNTIPCTRYNHCFVSVSNYQLCISRLSADHNHFLASIAAPIRGKPELELNTGHYVACVYNCLIGTILNTSIED